MFHVFNYASSREQKYLADAIDVDIVTLCWAARKGTPLPTADNSTADNSTADNSTADVILKLWKDEDCTKQSLGVNLLKAKGVLDARDQSLLIGNNHDVLDERSPLGNALSIVLPTHTDTDRALQLMADIYKTAVVNSGVHPLIWQNLLSRILMDVKPGKLAVALAREAFETGWIDVKQTSDSEDATPPYTHGLLFQVLHKLRKDNEELKPLADDYIKRWHHQFIKPRHDICWRCEKSTILNHSLSGHSPRLDSWLTVSSLNSTWSDEPEGVPDIGRLLAQVPAYRRTTSAQNHRRPVIIISAPNWYNTFVSDTTHRLLDLWKSKISDADKQRFDMSTDNSLKYNHCAKDADCRHAAFDLLRQQFYHYFFQKTTANGNQLHYCWFNARVEREEWQEWQEIGFGSHQPSSPQELSAMFRNISDEFFPKHKLDHTLINEALNTSKALILGFDNFTPILKEYLNSIDLDLLSDLLAAVGPRWE